MKEVAKHLYIPDGVVIDEPRIKLGQLMLSKNNEHRQLTETDLRVLADGLTRDLGETSPDLKSDGLAKGYSESLIAKLISQGTKTVEEIRIAGEAEFYVVGKKVLGPLAVGFVDTVLRNSGGRIIFPARDATPFFYIAKTLKTLKPGNYLVQLDDIQNPVFNRKLWGVDDEQDPDEVVPITQPLVQKLLQQIGFYSEVPKSFVEVGAWGTMIDQLKQSMANGLMPNEEFAVWFLYTHLPNNIFGFINTYGWDLPDRVLETIADTWEAFPKSFKRPSKLVDQDGRIKASLEGKIVNSPFLHAWQLAALQGVVDAACDFCFGKIVIDVHEELLRLWRLSDMARDGIFTGVLPYHTQTWTEGEEWKASWRWGKIPPLK